MDSYCGMVVAFDRVECANWMRSHRNAMVAFVVQWAVHRHWSHILSVNSMKRTVDEDDHVLNRSHC